MRIPLPTFIAVGLTLASIPAHAQSSSFIQDTARLIIPRVGVHGNVSVRHPVDQDMSEGLGIGPSIGLSPGRSNGWKYPIGITFFGEDLRSENGTTFGHMRSRAIVAGIGYGWHFGRLSPSVVLQTGYAFNQGQTTGNGLTALGYPDESVSVHIGNGVLLKPEVKAEYFITPKFTFRISGDYMLIRPDIVVSTPGGELRDRWNPSNFHANIGVGFYPFRK